MQPLQDIQYGIQFPTIKQKHGSLFVRTDLPGNRVYQYDAFNDTYVQIEAIQIEKNTFDKWYVVGFCNKRNTDVQGTRPNPFIGNLNTTYVIESYDLYGDGIYYNGKRMVILDGPYKNKSDAEDIKDSFLNTLDQICQNRTAIEISWTSNDGCDLDLGFRIIDEVYGYNHDRNGSYAEWYGDDTSCNGTEKIAIKKDALLNAGYKSVSVSIAAHWHGSKRSGNTIVKVINANDQPIIKQCHFDECCGFTDDDDVDGYVTIDLINDTVAFTGSMVNTTSLIEQLPEDLR
jgi:hypothetical protein